MPRGTWGPNASGPHLSHISCLSRTLITLYVVFFLISFNFKIRGLNEKTVDNVLFLSCV